MKRNKRKTFAYRPSDKIISRESIVSVILGAAGIIGYYLLLFGSIKTGGTSSPLSGAGGWILLVVSAIGLYFGIQSMKDTAAVMKWKIIGCTCNGIVLAISVIIFMIGIISMILVKKWRDDLNTMLSERHELNKIALLELKKDVEETR